MPPSSKERIFSLGQIITDFANAKSPDDAVRACFEDLGKFLNFPPDFKTEIEKRFPFLDVFENSLSFLDRRLLILVYEEERIKTLLKNLLEPEGMGLDYYIPEKNTLMLMQFEHEQVGSHDGEPDFIIHTTGPHPYKSEEVAELIDNSNCDFYKRDCNYQREIDNLMQFGTEINRIRKNASENVRDDPLKVAKKYDELKTLNDNLRKCHENYQIILSAIIEGKKLHNIPEFNSFLIQYNSSRPNVLTITDENYLIENPPAGQKISLREQSPEKWYQTMKKHLSYVLIDFFRIKDSYKYIKICDECHKFYISKIVRPQRFCSSKCRLKWNNRKRIESGENKEYKRQKRAEGAKESYYG